MFFLWQAPWRGDERSRMLAPRCSTSRSIRTPTAAMPARGKPGASRRSGRRSPRGTTVSPERTIRWARWDAETPPSPLPPPPNALAPPRAYSGKQKRHSIQRKPDVGVSHCHILHLQTKQTHDGERVLSSNLTGSWWSGPDPQPFPMQCDLASFSILILFSLLSFLFLFYFFKACQGVKEAFVALARSVMCFWFCWASPLSD